MLDYISKELQARMHTETDESQSETQMNEAILEYAHLFQELDDLSMKGTSAGSSRPYTKIDIPLEDDIEIDSVEMNLLDGRVTNVPMDATVQESDLALEHFGMKTYDQIYTETYNSMTQFARETDAAFEERVTAEAAVAYKKYTDQIIQEGLFGFGKISISDNSVPSRITLDFGKHPDKGSYYVKLPIGWQVDKKHRILKKQLESIQVLQKYFDNIGTQLRQILFNQHGAELGVERPYDIWEKITPTEVIVPVEPMDKYCVSFGFEIDGKEGSEAYPYITWTVPIKGSHNATEKNFTKTSEADIKKLHATTKREAIQEMAYEAEHQTARPSRFFQEAIDFGNPDEAPATDSNAADVSIDTPPADGQAQAAPDAGADVTTDAPATDDNKEAIETNDVSDQIAEKVAADTKADNADDSSDVNIDDLMDDNGTTDATDTNDVDLSDAADAPTDEELAADIGDEGSTDAEPVEDTSNLDFDNMTIDELLAQGTEKLKGMTIQQLKDFMNSGDTSTEETEEELAQEAFFLTRGNIGKELDIHLRKTMGVLNNNDMDITELCSQFRKEGKKLNRVVHKASGMKKVFDESERNQLRRLNHVLADLIALMRSDVDDNSVSVVKRLIQAFVSEATAVAKIVESKNPKHVQEAATSDSSSLSEILQRIDKYEKKLNDSKSDTKTSDLTRTHLITLYENYIQKADELQDANDKQTVSIMEKLIDIIGQVSNPTYHALMIQYGLILGYNFKKYSSKAADPGKYANDAVAQFLLNSIKNKSSDKISDKVFFPEFEPYAEFINDKISKKEFVKKVNELVNGGEHAGEKLAFRMAAIGIGSVKNDNLIGFI